MDFVQVSPVFFTCTSLYVCVHFVYVCGSIKFLVTFRNLCDHHYDQDTKLSHNTKEHSLAIPLWSHPAPIPSPWQPLIYFPSLLLCHFENSV